MVADDDGFGEFRAHGQHDLAPAIAGDFGISRKIFFASL